MRRALAVPAICLATALSGCAHTAFVLKEPVKEYSEGNYIFGTFMLICLPVMVPIFMVADAFEFLDVSEQDVAVIAQAGQDYMTAKAAQDQANAKAQAQALAAMQQQQQQQQQYQEQLRQQQQQQARSPQSAPQQVGMQTQAPAPASSSAAYDEYMERQRQDVAASNARIKAESERLHHIKAQYANASSCLSLVPREGSLYGGFINNCAYKVNVTWCNDGATGQGLGNFSDALDCRKNSLGADTIAANGRVGAHTNAPRVYWMACKAPFWPVHGKFTGDGVVAQCKD
jgi:hypothetical protein